MVKKKTKSKRMTVHLRNKIEKRVSQHHKKLRKIEREQARNGIKKVKKDPGVPNLWPFKEKIKAHNEREEERRALQRELNRQKLKEASQAGKASSSSIDKLQALAQSAQARSTEYEEHYTDESLESFFSTKEKIAGDNNRRTYFRQLKSVLDQSDVILEVLDARDPVGCRCKWLEDKILSLDSSKHIILVMNKIDLVPKDIVTSWLAILRKDFPTIAFKACTTSGNRMTRAEIKGEKASDSVLGSNKCVGGDSLLQLIKNYSRSGDMKTSVTVGVIGYPNVGKSSLINSMKRSRSVGVSSTPGFTKNIQEVQLDSKVKLIDSPGVIFHDDTNDTNFLRNCISISAVEDPEGIVEKVLNKLNVAFLMEHYNIPIYHNCNEFLYLIGNKYGKLLNGGVPDKKAAAKIVIQDWNSGKVPFYVNPPKIITETELEIVENEGEELNLSKKAKMALDELNKAASAKKYLVLSGDDNMGGTMEEDSEVDDGEDGEDEEGEEDEDDEME